MFVSVSSLAMALILDGATIAAAAAAALGSRAVDEEDEADVCDGQDESVEAGPGAAAVGLALVKVLLVADVLDRCHGEVEPLCELDVAHDRERDEPVDELHQQRDVEEDHERVREMRGKPGEKPRESHQVVPRSVSALLRLEEEERMRQGESREAPG